MQNAQTHTDWRFTLAVGAILIVLTGAIPLYGLLRTPNGYVFTGNPSLNAADLSVYSSYIEQIRDGNVLVENLFTSDLVPARVLTPFWLILGLIARATRLPATLVFHIVRLLLIVPFLAIASVTIAEFLTQPIAGWSVRAVRRSALLLLAFSSGMSVLATGLFSLDLPATLRTMFLDLTTAEAITILTLSASPHFIASLALMLVTFTCALRFIRTSQWRWMYAAGASAAALVSFHPYYVPTIFGTLVAWAILEGIVALRVPWRMVGGITLALLMTAPSIGYRLWLLASDPATAGHAAQNILPAPVWWITLVSYGALVPLAALGIPTALRTQGRAARLLIAWLLTIAVLTASDLPFARKLFEGLHPVLAMLAVVGLPRALAFLRAHLPNRVARLSSTRIVALFLAVPILGLSTLTVFAYDLARYAVGAAEPNTPIGRLFYYPQDGMAAMRWLRANVHGRDATLALGVDGNFIPRYAARVSVLGHDHETTNAAWKLERINALAAGQLNDAEARALLTALRVRYILITDASRHLWSIAPATLPGAHLAYANAGAEVYALDIAP